MKSRFLLQRFYPLSNMDANMSDIDSQPFLYLPLGVLSCIGTAVSAEIVERRCQSRYRSQTQRLSFLTQPDRRFVPKDTGSKKSENQKSDQT